MVEFAPSGHPPRANSTIRSQIKQQHLVRTGDVVGVEKRSNQKRPLHEKAFLVKLVDVLRLAVLQAQGLAQGQAPVHPRDPGGWFRTLRV